MKWLRRLMCGWTTLTPHDLIVTPRSVSAFTTDCIVCGEQRWGVDGQHGTLPLTPSVEAMFMRMDSDERP